MRRWASCRPTRTNTRSAAATALAPKRVARRNRVAGIVETNLHADNGVVHVIDRVLLPADRNVVQTAQAQPSFSILVGAITAAGLVDALSAAGPFTVFAPTDDAFAALLTELGVTGSQNLTSAGNLRLWPHLHATDGFFAMIWRKS